MEQTVYNQTRLSKRGAVFYFRAAIPNDLQRHYGKREVIYSLRTKDRREAERLTRQASVRLDDEFEAVRGQQSGPPRQLAVADDEAIRTVCEAFREEYVLRTRQRTREHGGGSAWTWFLSKPVANAVERELVSLAAAHGRRGARMDDLERAVARLRQRPMFGGVRQQASVALLRTMRVWTKTHGIGRACPGYLTEPLAWFDGRIRIMA
jgi:hypothetical protein